MSLKTATPPNPSAPSGQDAEGCNPERFLTLLVEGAARSVPEVDTEIYRSFRDNLAKLAMQLPDRLPPEEKLAQIRAVLNEFDTYRKGTEGALRERLAGWRSLTAFLYNELLGSLGIDPSSPQAAQLLHATGSVATAQNIKEYHDQLDLFLHPKGATSSPGAAEFRKADHTTANDNAAGLRGGGSAIEHVKRLMEGGGKAFIVLFRLSCLSMINQRFGPEAVEDCLMAVAAFLTQSLHSDDAIYHWSDSSLLAILEGRANEQILTVELERVSAQNRETTVVIGGRSTMLRIPLMYDIHPLEQLNTAEDLRKITMLATAGNAR